MSIPELCIKRPVATALVMLGILVFGIAAYLMLPVDNLPTMDFPTINVQANLPGANPDTMSGAVATPLERRFSTIPGLETMNSNNTLGRTNITLQFALDRDIDGAAQDVQAQITQAARQLPVDMPAPPSYSKVNPADVPVLIIQLTSPTLPLSTVDRYAETFIAPRISTINGVAQVQVSGAQKYAVHIQMDPRALATRQIGVDDVENALNAGNVNMPTGTLWGAHQAVTLQASGQLYNAAAYKTLIVAYRNGAPVRLSDIANVVDSVENDKTANWYNGERNIGLQTFRQPGANTPEVVDKVLAVLPQLTQELPPALEMHVAIDRSIPVRRSVEDVKFTLLLSLALVILVIFLFLRNLSATAIPSMALPISIFGTFAVMYLCGYSLDNLSLMALTLSVGFVVDDAIVMLENIVRHIEHGESVLQAAQNGSAEIGFTIISMTLSLAAVFLPVLFMGGVLGRLLHEFAVTIMSAVLVSGVVSLTLTPMLCSRFLRAHHDEKPGRFFSAFEQIQVWMDNVYGWSLRVVLKHKLATMTVAVLLLVATGYLYSVVPKGFLQSEDADQIQIRTEAIEGASFDEMMQKEQQIAQIIQDDPYVLNVSTGIGGPGTINQGNGFISLKSRAVRPHVDQVIQEMRQKLARVPGMTTYLTNPPPFRIGGIGSNALYQFTMQDTNTEELYNIAGDFTNKVRNLPGLQDVSSDAQIKNPQVSVVLDRDKSSTFGVTAEQVEDALYSAYGQRQVSTIFAPEDQYHVILELLPADQRDPSALSSLYVHSKSGQLVPLNAVATFASNYGPLSVNHLGQLPAVTISFNLGPNVALGDAVNEITDLARQTLPSTVDTSFQGNAQAFQSSLTGLGTLFVMAIAVIYIVLGILYESFIHPITILSGLPSAGFGALLALEICHLAALKGWVSPQLDLALDLYGFVGVIMLVGIVKKNAIMMIDFAVEAQREGKSAEEAIYQGCLVRFRPIMMTTMAALMGTLPIAMGVGAGAETRRPLGVAVVGGLLFSQLVTLLLTPVFFVYMEQATQWASRTFGLHHDVQDTHPMPSPSSPGGPVGQPMTRSITKLPDSDRSDIY